MVNNQNIDSRTSEFVYMENIDCDFGNPSSEYQCLVAQGALMLSSTVEPK